MSVVVRGTFQEESYTLSPNDTPDTEPPPEFWPYWDDWIENNEAVGVPHWKRVPSYTEDEGFVAGCLAMLEDGATVEGFDVPEPDPELVY